MTSVWLPSMSVSSIARRVTVCGVVLLKVSTKELVKFDLTVDRLFGGEEPLFLVDEGQESEKNLTSVSELYEMIKTLGKKGISVTRYKGLGEMDADQLWETTMDPAKRRMLKVTMEDAYEAERIFTLLMGDEVEPRRRYIERFAETVKDLDV